MFVSTFVISTCNTLLDTLYTYCPTSFQCEDVNTTIDYSKSHQDCCGTCSCDKTCGHNQSCCLQDENEEYANAMGRTCIEAFVGDKDIFYANAGYAVMMVIYCTDRKLDCMNKNGTLNINPVSTSTSETYINEQCAICNNASDIKHWRSDVYVTTDGRQRDVWPGAENTVIATRIFRPSEGATPTACVASQIEDSQIRCSNEQYIHMCTSLNLPYTIKSNTYRNIFCFLCEIRRDKPFCVTSHGKQFTMPYTM